ncbi:hypothetical protein UFOVP336_49 [uncultured Caudovirales phage]|uniref:Uncharacterized protein n=1 Tax=uncultured Caudovirales phage TaxID=2100421 RepID=A0A6J5M293_9CAUD|nr:hypothetical protein UFOVP336_49 [uncultured Caudovirales phage]
MATDYSVQLRGVEGVASADPSTAMRAEQMRGEQVSSVISNASSTIFDAYKGFKEEEVRQDVQGDYDNLKWEMNAIKDAEQRNNSIAQVTERTPAAVKAFRDEQERLGQAVLQMPERASEWRMRSSKALREAIAKTPGMANTFRQVAQEITGIKDLDMYSVTNLYDEIDLVAKRQQQAQAAQQKAYEKGLEFFMKDTSGIGLMSNTQAAAAYAAMTDEQRLQIANGAFLTERAKKQNEELLKAGGEAIQNTITTIVADASLGNISLMNAQRVKLKEAGIDEAALVTGALTQEQRQNPRIRETLDSMATIHREHLDKRYKEALTAINGNQNIDATERRKATEYVQSWYKNSMENLQKHGVMGLLGAMVTSQEGDPYKTMQARLSIINSMRDALNLPQEVLTSLNAADEKMRGMARSSMEPQKLAAFDHVESLARSARSGVTDKQWWELVNKTNQNNASPTLEAPKTEVERTSFILVSEAANIEMRDANLAGTSNVPATLKAISAGFGMTERGEVLLTKFPGVLQQQVSLVPVSEREAFKDQVIRNFKNIVLREDGPASRAWENARAENEALTLRASKLVMLDPSGATPLKMGAVHKDTKPMSDYSGVSLTGPKTVNNFLTAVDTAIRVRAMVTNTDVRVLRKEFIDIFTKGKPSEVNRRFIADVASAAQQPEGNGATKEPSKKPLVSDWNQAR